MTETTKPAFVEFDLAEFWSEKAMWAANYFVLWPLGLALTIDVTTGPVDPEMWCGSSKIHPGHADGDFGVMVKINGCSGVVPGDDATNLHVRQWDYGDEQGENINATEEENRADYLVFLTFVRRRLLEMKPEERRITMARYLENKIATAESVLAAEA